MLQATLLLMQTGDVSAFLLLLSPCVSLLSAAWSQADYTCGTCAAAGRRFVKDALPVKLLCFVDFLAQISLRMFLVALLMAHAVSLGWLLLCLLVVEAFGYAAWRQKKGGDVSF